MSSFLLTRGGFAVTAMIPSRGGVAASSRLARCCLSTSGSSASATASSMDRPTALRLLGLGGGSRRSRSPRHSHQQHQQHGSGPQLLHVRAPPPSLSNSSSTQSSSAAFSPRELRDAYFEAAKRCHPDSVNAALSSSSSDDNSSSSAGNSAKLFIRVTEAYEYLRTYASGGGPGGSAASAYESEASYVSKSEEEEFRDACREWLGVDAEIVEESKRCPLFREWLQGNTDAASHWQNFFCQHGGLAPKLRPPSALIEEGINGRSKGPGRRRRR